MSAPTPLRSSLTTQRRWDLLPFFPSLKSEAYATFVQRVRAELALAVTRASACPPLSQATLHAWTALALELERLTAETGHVETYLHLLANENTVDEAVRSENAAWAVTMAEVEKLRSELQRGLQTPDEALWALYLSQEALRTAEWMLQRLREAGQQQMDPALESLASDLGVNGLAAWGRLYDTLTGRMSFPMTLPDGSVQGISMAQRRALMADENRATRQAAFRDGQAPWIAHEDTLAACLNALAGTRLSLYQRRGGQHYLEKPLFLAAMSRASLDAMMTALRQHIEIPREAVRLAALRQGTPGLAFYDLEAPQCLDTDAPAWDWTTACHTVNDAFSQGYPALGEYFRTMLEKCWIESELRPHKRPGAFMTESAIIHEERVYMTHGDTLHDVMTLAHEVGHAWHTRAMRGLRPAQLRYPMTLAETASNFGEALLLHSLLQRPGLSAAQKAVLLDSELNRAHAYLLNIPMRFTFECAFYEERQHGEVSAARLKELMVAAQREWYGDSLLPGEEDPLFWASKMHFFITDVPFYNFPYVFGYLLTQALWARFQSEGPSFIPRYEAFLRLTGSASAETCVSQALGADITQPEFWAQGILAIQPRLQEMKALITQG